jgi:CubicO group peptidase (beta-lactamase class C family)
MAENAGVLSAANRQVQSVLDDLVACGEELGLQAAAYLHGDLVVDAWAGIADEATGRPVDGDTLFTIYSAGKGVTATCIHLLADRGRIDYDTPIAESWPEFAAHGKARVTVRHALSHQAGIPQMPDGATPEMMCDWDAMCAAIAELEPLWEPGTRAGYHALTYGWILGEVLRRVEGRSIAEFLQVEICRPLGITDLYFGIPVDAEPRVATLKNGPPPPGAQPPAPDSLVRRAMPPWFSADTAGLMNRPDIRHASIPAGGGIANARSLARHYAALAQGGALGGVRLLTAERLRVATRLQTDAKDEVLATATGPIRRALGYWLGGPDTSAPDPMAAAGPRHTAFGHAGAGGTIAFADPEMGFAFALTKNHLRSPVPGEPDTARLVAGAARRALGITG